VHPHMQVCGPMQIKRPFPYLSSSQKIPFIRSGKTQSKVKMADQPRLTAVEPSSLDAGVSLGAS
jgi:hypothetical protein